MALQPAINQQDEINIYFDKFEEVLNLLGVDDTNIEFEHGKSIKTIETLTSQLEPHSVEIIAGCDYTHLCQLELLDTDLKEYVDKISDRSVKEKANECLQVLLKLGHKILYPDDIDSTIELNRLFDSQLALSGELEVVKEKLNIKEGSQLDRIFDAVVNKVNKMGTGSNIEIVNGEKKETGIWAMLTQLTKGPQDPGTVELLNGFINETIPKDLTEDQKRELTTQMQEEVQNTRNVLPDIITMITDDLKGAGVPDDQLVQLDNLVKETRKGGKGDQLVQLDNLVKETRKGGKGDQLEVITEEEPDEDTEDIITYDKEPGENTVSLAEDILMKPILQHRGRVKGTQR